jgi:hypothetical protein
MVRRLLGRWRIAGRSHRVLRQRDPFSATPNRTDLRTRQPDLGAGTYTHPVSDGYPQHSR